MSYDERKSEKQLNSGPKQGPGFYPPDLVASIMTTLLLGADEKGNLYKNFRDQLGQTLKKAQETPGEAAAKLAGHLQVVADFYDAGNEDLFLNAHIGIKLLLEGLVATKRWSDCLTVSRNLVFDVASLPGH